MGSGSFGGGSGSFGGGSGGKGGSGTDSTHDRILGLTKLTDSVNANPEIAKVRAIIYNLLQDRTRSAFLRIALSDAMVVSAYRALLSLEAELRKGATVAAAVAKIKGSADMTLAALADAVYQNGQSDDTDERVERIVRRAVTDLLLRTVENSQELYYDTLVKDLDSRFNAASLRNTADIFLGTLIAGTLRSDLLDLNDSAKAVVDKASHEIAISWTDKFRDRSGKKAAPFSDMMQAISADYTAYSGGKD